MFANDPRDHVQAGGGQYSRPETQLHGEDLAADGGGPRYDPLFQQPERTPAQGDAGSVPFQEEHAQEQAALQAEIEELKAQLAAAEQKAGENHEHFVRASAEMENIRRRSREEIDKARKFAIEGFAESLLPVCDSLEMALTVEAPTVESIREGAQATLRQLQQALERNKVQIVDPLGQRFDPNSQQAISMQPTPGVPANHVAAVLQKGYLINDRVLRPAMVVVSQGG